jgi:hypothetical protein
MNFWKRVCVARPDPVLTNRFLTLQKKSGSRSGCHVMFGPYGYNTNIKSAHTFLVRWSNKICCNSNYILQSATSVSVDSYREGLNKAQTFFSQIAAYPKIIDLRLIWHFFASPFKTSCLLHFFTSPRREVDITWCSAYMATTQIAAPPMLFWFWTHKLDAFLKRKFLFLRR